MKKLLFTLALALAAGFLTLTASAVTFTTDTTIAAGDATYDGQDIVVQACTVTINGPHSFNSLQVVSGGVVTHSPAASDQSANQLNLTIANDVLVDAASRMDATGKGYNAAFSGPGAGASLVGSTWNDWGGGGGYGGWGATSSAGLQGGSPYGSILQPVDWGSEGGSCPSHGGAGGAGGGAIRLVVNGTLTVDGQILAIGISDPPDDLEIGGGSGGSIWLTVGTLSGTGTVSADGGRGDTDGDGGGGSGGRVAIYYGVNSFSGKITAGAGAPCSFVGGAGTVYTKATAETVGTVLVDNAGYPGAMTSLSAPEPFRVVITNCAAVCPQAPLTWGSLLIATNGALVPAPGSTGLVVTVSGDATIAAGGAVNADAGGYPIGTNAGPGVGVAGNGGGGGAYGGQGGFSYSGAPGGAAYGSVLEPVDFGSQGGSGNGGPGGHGGGAIRLTVDGILTVNGRLTAEGGYGSANNSGGGSGGSIYLTVGELVGAGVISANGGIGEATTDGGGGGGGRIAVYYSVNAFAGSVTACGGIGAERGGAGTIYMKYARDWYGALLVDNGGNAGDLTPLTSPDSFRLTVANRAVVYPLEPLALSSLFIGTNATMTHLNGQTGIVVSVVGDALVDLGGEITANGKGYPIGTNAGPGLGVAGNGGGGGGYAGQGGFSYSSAPGGGAYGSVLEPVDLGSQGGSGNGGPGGYGGGAIRLTVGGTLTINGGVTAEGGYGSANNSGGGSGGSIYLTVGELAGAGVISANGGIGEAGTDGGGGGGGRIAIYYINNTFAGVISAYGALGATWGGAGTFYSKASADPVGRLCVQNPNASGALTPLTSPVAFNLVVENGGIAQPIAPLTVSSLLVSTNGQLFYAGGQPAITLTVINDLAITTNASIWANSAITVHGKATIEQGGAISANGKGYWLDSDPGPGGGATGSDTGGGGGYGGPGGHGYLGASEPGGPAYGSMLTPADWGSTGGGSLDDGTSRSPGGGAIRLVVDGTLTVNGDLCSDGGGAWHNDQGGAAGGSIYVTAGTLTGSGSIHANGGNGEANAHGGGGAGGRVAIYCGADTFTGTKTTYGAPGAAYGGAGTIYVKAGSDPSGELIVNAGGANGSWTPLTSPTGFKLTIANGAVVYSSAPLTVQALHVASGGMVTHLPGQGSLNLTAAGDVTIDAGGAISADGRGYPVGPDGGPGVGSTSGCCGAGGSYGGEGGNSWGGAPAGHTYGSILQPADFGSQGGTGYGAPGGAGGGAIRMNVAGTLTVNGRLSADGDPWSYNNCGGGAGGSVSLTLGTLAGSGRISVDGGRGEDGDGGGGGGGRLAVYYGTNSFAGLMTAWGGDGAQLGAAGTVYTKDATQPVGSLLIENVGASGALTPLTSPEAFNLTVSTNALTYPQQPLTVSNLLVTANGYLTHLNGQSNLEVHVLGNAVIDAGGQLNVDGKGYPLSADRGPGVGSTSGSCGGGAGYGGAGGEGGGGAAGGPSYGSLTEPVDLGSQGGPGYGAYGGAGGGALRLTVGGTLTLDGELSANGSASGVNNGGGGSGGSIYLTAGVLAGAGTISANGGNGEDGDGGGGGGGRIAIYSGDVSGFDVANHIAVAGGGGSAAGGAGTIYLGSIVPLTIAYEVSGGTLTLKIASAAGYTYQLLSSTNLADWQVLGPAKAGDGTLLTWSVPMASPPLAFYRLQIY